MKYHKLFSLLFLIALLCMGIVSYGQTSIFKADTVQFEFIKIVNYDTLNEADDAYKSHDFSIFINANDSVFINGTIGIPNDCLAFLSYAKNYQKRERNSKSYYEYEMKPFGINIDDSTKVLIDKLQDNNPIVNYYTPLKSFYLFPMLFPICFDIDTKYFNMLQENPFLSSYINKKHTSIELKNGKAIDCEVFELEFMQSYNIDEGMVVWHGYIFVEKASGFPVFFTGNLYTKNYPDCKDAQCAFTVTNIIYKTVLMK